MAGYSYAVVGGGFVKKDVESGAYLIFDTEDDAERAIRSSLCDGDELKIVRVDIKKADVE